MGRFLRFDSKVMSIKIGRLKNGVGMRKCLNVLRSKKKVKYARIQGISNPIPVPSKFTKAFTSAHHACLVKAIPPYKYISSPLLKLSMRSWASGYGRTRRTRMSSSMTLMAIPASVTLNFIYFFKSFDGCMGFRFESEGEGRVLRVTRVRWG
jgi:hypothetical protein